MRSIVFIGAVLFAGIITGLFFAFLILPSKPSLPSPPEVPPEEVLKKAIRHPAVISLNATASGTTIRKTENSFVIEKDGQDLEIYWAPGNLSGFHKMSTGGAGGSSLGLSELQIGDKVQGGATIVLRESQYYGGYGYPVGTVIASRFNIKE